MVDLQLVDTSAWIEWLRDTGSPAAQLVGELRQDPRSVAVTQPVALEVRAGTRRANLPAINRILDNAVQLSVAPDEDFDVAGELYARSRDIGRPVRALMDCLIAAVAIRTSAVLVHQDRDFQTLSMVATELRTRSALTDKP